jgi:hypothetical protein
MRAGPDLCLTHLTGPIDPGLCRASFHHGIESVQKPGRLSEGPASVKKVAAVTIMIAIQKMPRGKVEGKAFIN